MRTETCLVTVTYNSDTYIDKFIESFIKLGDDVFLFIFDNNSSDNTVQKIKILNHPRIFLDVSSENIGVAAGNNAGIIFAQQNQFRYVCIINNDTEFQSELISYLKTGLDRADVVTPKIVYAEHRQIIWAAGGKFSILKGGSTIHIGENCSTFDEKFNKYYFVNYVPTCCVMMEVNLFASVGMFDERYFVYFDDTDFMLNLHRSKKKILYCPEETVIHKVSSSTGGNESAFTLHHSIRNHVFYIRKNFNFVEKIILLGFATAFFLYKELKVIFYNPSNVLIIPKAYIEGFKLKL